MRQPLFSPRAQERLTQEQARASALQARIDEIQGGRQSDVLDQARNAAGVEAEMRVLQVGGQTESPLSILLVAVGAALATRVIIRVARGLS